MKQSSTAKFFQQYFTATQFVCSGWLARLTADQKLEILEDLMQWDVVCPTSENAAMPIDE